MLIIFAAIVINICVTEEMKLLRLRELVKIKLPKIKKGIDGVVVIMPGFEINDFWELEEIVNKLFKKANIYRQ